MSLYEEITQQIIRSIEQGAGKFQMPWHYKDSFPANPISKTSYRGMNCLVLWARQEEKSFNSSHWATFNQWKEAGGYVRKGESGTTILFYRKIEEEDEETRIVLRSYRVFNWDQVEGNKVLSAPVEEIPSVDAFIERTGAEIAYGGGIAAYQPKKDRIIIPERNAFIGSPTSSPTETFYSTLFHELVHWSGAEHRLCRDLSGRFGSMDYAAEELVAELGAAFLCGSFQVTSSPREDHAHYVASWLSVLKNDTRAIFTAPSLGRRAAEYLQSL